MRHYLTPVRIAIIKKRPQITNANKDVEERESLYIVGGNINWHSRCGNSMEVPQKTKSRTTI